MLWCDVCMWWCHDVCMYVLMYVGANFNASFTKGRDKRNLSTSSPEFWTNKVRFPRQKTEYYILGYEDVHKQPNEPRHHGTMMNAPWLIKYARCNSVLFCCAFIFVWFTSVGVFPGTNGYCSLTWWLAARSNTSVGASFAANSAFSNDSLASTRSRYGWTTTLSTPFSSCHGKRLNLKKEEVCARKQLFEPGNFFARKSLVSCTRTFVICGHINGSSHITEQVHLWQHDDYLAVDEALWRLFHCAMEKPRRVGGIYDIFIT